MGEQNVHQENTPEQLRKFMKSLLNDVYAFELMLESGLLESDIRRIGAEQEMFLVDQTGRPASIATKVLESIDDEHFTTELARYNLEANLDPQVFSGKCLSNMEKQINELLAKARIAAKENGARIMLTGILPTLRTTDVTLDNMTPNPRYFALNDALTALRGSDYEFHIDGTDEFLIRHNSIMLESCNTSFQIHFQVSPDEFANLYNLSQFVTAPVLAIATNSPLLFGRRLWRETRIALFQQSIDTRSVDHQLRERQARVSFGKNWIHSSPLEIVRDDIARFRVLLGTDIEENALEKIRAGVAPKFQAMRLHGGTVYHWNRMCYGLTGGKPHLRIENRALPAGPTPVDEMANAAFFFGLMSIAATHYGEIRNKMDFEDARNNFLNAARVGLDAHFRWIDGNNYSASELVLKELLPLAREGLQKAGIDKQDSERYLDLVEERVKTGKTASRWMLESYNRMRQKGTDDQSLRSIVATTVENQEVGRPAHEWSLAKLRNVGGWGQSYLKVSQFMTLDLFTVHQDELLDLVAKLMEWQQIRHVPVEDNNGNLVGIVSYRTILRNYSKKISGKINDLTAVHEVMTTDPVTITAEMGNVEAMDLMRQKKIGCLPVVKEGQLIGIITERDFSAIAGILVESKIHEYQEQRDTRETRMIKATEGRDYMYVGQIMSSQFLHVSPEENLVSVAEKMVQHHALHALVQDKERRLLGMFSYRALLREFSHCENKKVGDVMKTDIMTLSPGSASVDAIQLMRDNRMGCIPVIENGRLAGVITERHYSEIGGRLLEEKISGVK